MPQDAHAPVDLEDIVNAQVTELQQLERENAVLAAAAAASAERETVLTAQFRVVLCAQGIIRGKAERDSGEDHDTPTEAPAEAAADTAAEAAAALDMAVSIVEQTTELAKLEKQVQAMHEELDRTDDATGEIHGIPRLCATDREFLFELLAHHKHVREQIAVFREDALEQTRAYEAHTAQHEQVLQALALEALAQHEAHNRQQQARSLQAAAQDAAQQTHHAARMLEAHTEHEKCLAQETARAREAAAEHDAHMRNALAEQHAARTEETTRALEVAATHKAQESDAAAERESKNAQHEKRMALALDEHAAYKAQVATEREGLALQRTEDKEAYKRQDAADQEARKRQAAADNDAIAEHHAREHAAVLETFQTEANTASALAEQIQSEYAERARGLEHDISAAETELRDAQLTTELYNADAAAEVAKAAATLDDMYGKIAELGEGLASEMLRHDALCEASASVAAATAAAEDELALTLACTAESAAALAAVRLDIKELSARKQFLAGHVMTLETVITTLSTKYADFSRYTAQQHTCDTHGDGECKKANTYVFEMTALVESMLEDLHTKLDLKTKLMVSLLESSDVATLA